MQKNRFSLTLQTLFWVFASVATLLSWFNQGDGVVDSRLLTTNDYMYCGPTERLRDMSEYAAWERRIPVKDGRWSPPKAPSPPRGVDFEVHDYLVMPVGERSRDKQVTFVSGYQFSLRFNGLLLILNGRKQAHGSCAQDLGIPKQASVWYTRKHGPLICDLIVIMIAIAMPVLSHFKRFLRAKSGVMRGLPRVEVEKGIP